MGQKGFLSSSACCAGYKKGEMKNKIKIYLPKKELKFCTLFFCCWFFIFLTFPCGYKLKTSKNYPLAIDLLGSKELTLLTTPAWNY